MKLFNTMLLVSLIIGVSVEISFAKFNNLTKKQLKHYKPLKANEDYDGGDYDCHLDVSHKIMDNRGNILLREQIKSQGYREKECNILNKKLESKKR